MKPDQALRNDLLGGGASDQEPGTSEEKSAFALSACPSPHPPGTAADDPRLIRALEEYLSALEHGQRPKRQEFLERYREIATPLAECLDGLEFVTDVAPLLPASAAESLAASAPFSDLSALTREPQVAAAGGGQAEIPLGDYRIVREIGRGGMGVVYEAVQLSLGRRVALKVLPFAAALDAKQLQRFKNEAHAAAHLQHQNIVPIYAVGCERGVHFYAMQFVEGQTLAALIQELRQLKEGENRGSRIEDRGSQEGALDSQRTGPFIEQQESRQTSEEKEGKEAATTLVGLGSETVPALPRSSILDPPSSFFRTVSNLGIQAAEALEHAHQLGVIHRDIKPANMMVDARGNLWITDFGLAHCQSQAGLTMTGDLLGTLRYMSPEQALAKRVIVDGRTDIYSLGITLYELLTLEPAFPGTDRQELLRQIAFEDPKPPRRWNKRIPAELETIVLKALEKSPADRYAIAQELADDLERYLKDEPIRAKRPTLVQQARKWTQRHKAAVRAAVACLSVTLIALGSAIGWALRDRAAREEGLDQTVDRVLDDEALPVIKEGKWPEARAAVERADQLLEAAGRKERPARLLVLQKELSMADRLEEIYGEPKRSRKANVLISSGNGASHQYQAELDPADEEFYRGQKQDRRFAQAFQEFGIDVEALAPAEAAAAIGRTSIRPALVQALDEWVGMRKRARGEDDPFWKKLVEVARLADPDEWRNRFREALLRRDRPALEKLADTVPIREVPPATASLLAFALKDLGAVDKATTVLREAHRHHPEDFWLNNTLGWWSRDVLQPPRQEDALRYFMAAVVLRPRSGHAHWDLAVTLEQKGERDEAIAEYDKAVEMAPNNAVVWNARGDFYSEKLHEYDKALADYTKAIELDPSFAEAWWDRSWAYRDLHQHDKSLADANKAVELSPNNPVAWYCRSDAYLGLHHYDKALADADKAIELNPKDGWSWSRRGFSYFGLHQYDKALADFSRAIELAPKNAVHRINRGGAYTYLFQYDKALADLNRAIELNPKDAVPWAYRGFTYKELHEYDKALADCSKAIELDPKWAFGWSYRGDTYRALHQYDKALADLSKGIESGPMIAWAWAYRALAYLELHQYDKSFADYSKALELDPIDAVFWNDRGLAYSKAHQYDKALADLSKAIELDPNLASAWNNRGLAYGDLHQYDKAIADLSKAIQLDPKDAWDWYNRGYTYTELHQYEKALADLNKAIELDPKSAVAWNSRAHAFANLSQWDKAIADFSKAIEVNPGDPNPWYARALVRLQLGDYVGYQKECAGLLEQFGRPDKPDVTDRVAWTVILAPDAVKNLDKPVELAELAIRTDPKDDGRSSTLGAALYRAGRFAEAVTRLEKAARALAKDSGKLAMRSPAYAWFFLAMAHQRLGDAEEGRKSLDKAIKQMEEETKNKGSHLEPPLDFAAPAPRSRRNAERVGPTTADTEEGETGSQAATALTAFNLGALAWPANGTERQNRPVSSSRQACLHRPDSVRTLGCARPERCVCIICEGSSSGRRHLYRTNFVEKGPAMTLMILAVVLPWFLWGVGLWLGYQLLLQNGRIVLRLEILENQMRQLVEALDPDSDTSAREESKQPHNATANGHVANAVRGKANKGLGYSRIKRNGLKAGKQAPSFRLPRLDVGELALEDYRGRRVLLVFSDPECGPCEELAPHLEQFHRQNRDIEVLMISRGEAKTNRKKAAALRLTFPIVLQRQWEISFLYGMFAVPIAYWIDEQGALAADVSIGVEAILRLMAEAIQPTEQPVRA